MLEQGGGCSLVPSVQLGPVASRKRPLKPFRSVSLSLSLSLALSVPLAPYLPRLWLVVAVVVLSIVQLADGNIVYI